MNENKHANDNSTRKWRVSEEMRACHIANDGIIQGLLTDRLLSIFIGDTTDMWESSFQCGI